MDLYGRPLPRSTKYWTLAGAAAFLIALGVPTAQAERKQKLVEVLPFTNLEEGLVWLVDKALDEIGDETWSQVKDEIKDRWWRESDPYSDDWADNSPLSPFWLGGSYHKGKSEGGTEIIQSFQGSKLLASTASGHHYEARDGRVIHNRALTGYAASSLIDREGMNLSGWKRTYALDYRQRLTDANGTSYWSEWSIGPTSNSWHGTGGSPDMAAIHSDVATLNTPTSQFRLGTLMSLVDESWSVGSYYFRTVVNSSPQAHPKVKEEPGSFIVTVSGSYTDVTYGGEGVSNDVGRTVPIMKRITCSFNQGATEVEHGVPFFLGSNQRLISMRTTGSAKRSAFRHDVKGKFEEQIPVFTGNGNISPTPTTWRTETFEAKVSEEYLVREVKYNQP